MLNSFWVHPGPSEAFNRYNDARDAVLPFTLKQTVTVDLHMAGLAALAQQNDTALMDCKRPANPS
jgi:hypothetical protein